MKLFTMLTKGFCPLFIILLTVCHLSPAEMRETLRVSPACEKDQLSCLDFNTAISNLSDNMQLQLLEGNYTITKSVLVRNVSSISIIGVGLVVLTCKDDQAGVSFVSVDKLNITNLVIKFCSLSGQPAQDVMTHAIMESPISSAVVINSVKSYSMFIASCNDVLVENVLISDSNGTGLVAFNVMGLSSLADVTFSRNAGGGLFMMYFDNCINCDQQVRGTEPVNVNISNCTFSGNTNDVSPLISAYEVQYSPLVSAGGGMTIILAQTNFGVQIDISHSIFHTNSAPYGGGAHVGMFSGIHASLVHFSSCIFEYNSVDCNFGNGGGLFVLLGIASEQFYSLLTNSGVTVSDSMFIGNRAYDGGGLFVLSLDPTHNVAIMFTLLVLKENVAKKASAISAYDFSRFSSSSIDIVLQNCTIESNKSPETLSVSAAAMIVDRAKLALKGNNFFLDTDGSAVLSRNGGTINLFGYTLIAGNRGVNGGAIHLSDTAYLRLYNNSQLHLQNNSATLSGGAIYVDSCKDSSCCFIFPDGNILFENCTFINQFNTLIHFSANQAPNAASVYGSSLRACKWNRDRIYFNDIHQNIYTACGNRGFMVFDNETKQFSTPSTSLKTNTTDCILTKPGQQLTLLIGSYDAFNQSISDILTSHIVNINCDQPESKLGRDGLWSLNANASLVPITVFGRQNETVDVELLSTLSLSSVQISFCLQSCGLGYVYNSSVGSCRCDQDLTHIFVKCTLSTLTVPPNIWLGSGEGAAEGLLVWGHCPTGYCKDGSKSIEQNDFSIQCRADSKRMGALCGQCNDGLSVVLGSARVCRDCSNTSLFMVVVLLLLGIILIVMLAFFRVSISDGYLNSILFYSNILTLYGKHFVEPEWQVIFIVTDLLSLRLNFNYCLYDGMTDVGATMVQYIFILYIFLLMGIVYLITSRFMLPGSYADSPAKVGVTLVLLCQVSLMESCVTSLSFVRIRTLNDSVVLYRWLRDPDLTYIKSIHALPFVFALLAILLLLMPFTLILSYPRCTYRVAFLAKFKPIYDAVWAPFKKNRRWWFVFRLVLRWVIYVCATTLTNSHDSNFAIALILLVLFFLQVRLKPYTKEWINVLDDCLLVIVLVLTLGGLYYMYATPPLVFTLVFISTFYSVLILVATVHVWTNFSSLISGYKTLYQLMVTCGRWCCKRQHYELVEEVGRMTVTNTEISIAGLVESPNLNETTIVTTMGEPVTNATIMHHLTYEETEKDATGVDESKSENMLSQDSLTDREGTDDRFYTCRDAKDN